MNFFMLSSAIKVGLQRGIQYNCVFLFKTFIQCVKHAKCIAIDIF